MMRRKLLQGLGLIAVVAVMVVTLRDRIPSPGEIGTALRQADPTWLLVAAIAEFVSMGMFARQQRRLLTGFGLTLHRRRMLALSYSRSAIAISLPAGSAVSAGYAFQQFRAGGADRKAAAAVMVLSGLLSVLGLALLYGSGALASGVLHLSRAWNAHPAIGLTVVAVLLAGLVWLFAALVPRPRARERLRPPSWLRPLLEAFDASRAVARRHWLLALAAAVANWLADLICLIAAVRAFGIDLGLLELATVYLAVQLVRQIPITPGGIGVIEVSLLTGLASAGAAEPAAAAAVLTYRLLSCWLVIPVGLLCGLALRHAANRGDGGLPSARPPQPWRQLSWRRSPGAPFAPRTMEMVRRADPVAVPLTARSSGSS